MPVSGGACGSLLGIKVLKQLHLLRCQHEIGYNPFSPNFSRLHPSFNISTILFSSIFDRFCHEKMGKQSSFTRQNAYDVLCMISPASQRNSTLEVDLRRTWKIVSVLASRLLEAHLIIGILEEALFSLLPPVPILLAPPLPPRPDVVMDPPASEESGTAPACSPRFVPPPACTDVRPSRLAGGSGPHPRTTPAHRPHSPGSTCPAQTRRGDGPPWFTGGCGSHPRACRPRACRPPPASRFPHRTSPGLLRPRNPGSPDFDILAAPPQGPYPTRATLARSHKVPPL